MQNYPQMIILKSSKGEFDVPINMSMNAIIIIKGKFSGIIREIAGAPRVVFQTSPVAVEEKDIHEDEEQALDEVRAPLMRPKSSHC